MAAALVLGLVAVQLLLLSPEATSAAVIIALVLHQVVFVLCRRRRHLVSGAAALIAALAAGAAVGAVEPWSRPLFKHSEQLLAGQVSKVSRGRDDRWRARLRLEAVATVGKGEAGPLRSTFPGELFVTLDEPDARRLVPRQRVLVRVRQVRDRQRANFGDGSWSRPPRFAWAVAGPLVIDEAPWWARALERLRRRLRARLHRVLEPEAAALATALVVGDRSGLPAATMDAFRRTGAAHLLAVSGLHISLISGLIFWGCTAVLLRTSLAARGRVAALAVAPATLGCWSYALVTGAGPPAVRAAIMTSAALLAWAVGRPSRADHAVWLAAVILLVDRPELAFRAGFQLSFAAVLVLQRLGLSGLTRSTSNEADSGGLVRCGRALRKATTTALIASLVTAPVVAHHFGYLSPWAPVVNVVAVPVMGAALLPATLILAAVAAAWEPLGGVLALPVGAGLELFLGGLRAASELPSSAVSVPRPTMLEATGLVTALVLVLWRRRWMTLVALALVAVVTVTAIARLQAPRLQRELRLTFVDVGSGDATLIELPGGGRVLIDAGPRAAQVSSPNEVVTALGRRGWGQLRLLALTHGHADHVTGAPAVLEAVGAASLWRPGVESGPRRCGAQVIGGVRFEVLYPCDRSVAGLEENDRSLVLRLVYGDVAVLLPGDIEAAAEARLLSAGHQLRAQVLKLPHHGSDTSSSEAFLEAVDPELAVASCGRSRRRRLPHPRVAARLARRGAMVLGTAEVGAVEVVTDGERIEVATARLGAVRLRAAGR